MFKSLGESPGCVGFVDAGTYIVYDTVLIPPGARIVGEALSSIIMGAGAKFSDINQPRAVVKVGNAGQTGYVEWSDMIVATRGATAGAKLIEYNLNTASGQPSGMWDVHTRIGGFAGTNLQLSQCPKTPTQQNYVNPNCIAAYMSMHITVSASNLFMENNWMWVADHDLEDDNYTQITVFAARGMLIESTAGKIWISAGGSEHHTLYQYQLVKTQNIYMGQVQTETPYYQPNPPATMPFSPVAARHDPDFVAGCGTVAPAPGAPPCAMAWGLRIISSRNIVMFGIGFYSFFNNYSTDCAQTSTPTKCQSRIFELKNVGVTAVTGVTAYNLNTIGSKSMVTRLGSDIALFSDNVAGFASNICIYKH
jgi:glucan 1,3-beta-glucosidase